MTELAKPRDTIVVMERGTEPFSGLAMVWIGGLLPEIAFDPSAQIDVAIDGIVKLSHPLRPLGPEGSAFDVQVIEEPGIRRVAVVLRTTGGMVTLAEQDLDAIHRRAVAGIARPVGEQIRSLQTRLRQYAQRFARKVRTGEVLRPRRWQDWSKRLARKVSRRLQSAPPPPLVAAGDDGRTAYEAYVANNALTPRLRAVYEDQARAFSYRPLISIVMPVYNVPVRFLRAAVESIKAQVYDNWQLCLADDASTDLELRAYLRFLAENEERVRVVFRPHNGHICAASNSAAEQATGEFVAFMDNDDTLAPDALFHYVRLLQTHRDADVFYSDEDKIDVAGRRYDPQFKPDWSPEMFLSYNYVNHFTCIRRELFERAGRFRLGFEGAQDYDLLWRVVERTDRIHHVPRILYHWRSLPGSTAAAAAVKPIMFTSCERGLRDHLERCRITATPYAPAFAERLRLPISLLDFADDGPDVAVLIVATDERAPTRAGIQRLRDRTTYQNLRVYVLDCTTATGSAYQSVRALAAGGVSVIRAGSGAASLAVNGAAAALAEEFIALIDPALEILEPRWLTRLVGYAGLDGVGGTGPRVVDEDNCVRHAGIVLNLYDETAPGRAFEGQPADDVSYYFQAEVARNVAAVSGDCLVTRRQLFTSIGAFDAARFPGALAAVDYCRRLAARGLRTVYVGGAELRQTGPTLRRDDPREVAALLARHGRQADPYYNPNLSHRFSFRPDTGCPQAPELPHGRTVSVLFAAHNLSATEGAPRYLFDIAVGLKQRGRVRASIFSPLEGPGREWYKRAGVPVHVGHLPYAHQVLGAKWQAHEYRAALEAAAKLLTERRPDVLVANTLCTFPMVEAAARAGIPTVWIIHESYNAEQMRVLHSAFALDRCRAAFALADRVLIASHDTARLFDGVNGRHTVEVIHNGLEASAIEEYRRAVTPATAAQFIPGPRERKRITAIGTVCERKGQHTLVEAAAFLRRRGRTDFCVYLVGVRDTSLSYVNYIRAMIEREQLHDLVQLIPETNDVRPYLRATDIFVCASHVEAFSRSMLEAEAFGLPIVTTPCCGANEQVVWDRNALRFEMSDSRQLAEHLDRLLSDDQLRQQMGECSRAVYECHLTNEDMLVRYERLLLNVWLHAALVSESPAQSLDRAA